jgi:uncharacterized protein
LEQDSTWTSLDVNAKNAAGRTALHCAAAQGYRDVVENLLRRGADINMAAVHTPFYTPLFEALSNGRKEVALLLISRGANVNGDTISALHLTQDIEIVSILLEKGANPNATDVVGITPLHMAVPKGSKDVIKLLIERGADIETFAPYLRRNALHMASGSGNAEAVAALLEKGANIEAQADPENDGSTALHISALISSLEVTKLLLDRGADVHAMTFDGRTALHYAAGAWEAKIEVIKTLLDHGADIHVQTTKEGELPLHTAALSGNAMIVGLLYRLQFALSTEGNIEPETTKYPSFDEAKTSIELLSKLCEARPQDYISYQFLGRALWGDGQYDKAIEALEQSIELNPMNSSVTQVEQLQYKPPIECIKCMNEIVGVRYISRSWFGNQVCLQCYSTGKAEDPGFNSEDFIRIPSETWKLKTRVQ